jgi:hypothetical protein
MSTLGPIRIIWSGQSNAVAQTSTRVVPNAKYSPLNNVPSYVWFRALAALGDARVKRTPWHPYQANKSYLLNVGPANSRDWPGAELVCAWKLANMGHSPHVIQAAEGSSALATDWAPAGAGVGAYAALVFEYQQAIAAATSPANPGASRTVLCWLQGATDAANSTNANAYQANWNTFIAALRSAWSLPSLKVIMMRLHTGASATFTSTVQAQQDLIAAADPLVTLINTDAFQLSGDGAHYTDTGAESLGLAFASAIDGVMP